MEKLAKVRYKTTNEFIWLVKICELIMHLLNVPFVLEIWWWYIMKCS